MSEMVERVASAIFEACDYALPPHLIDKCARAAIAAMREPTQSMLDAGYADHYGDLAAICKAMIEGALK
jgi:hypothetical protein